jgi:hypothetical protein
MDISTTSFPPRISLRFPQCGVTTNQPENNEIPSDLVRVKQLKKYLPVSERCLLLWQAKGIIPGYRVGNTVFFSISEVLASIKKGGR